MTARMIDAIPTANTNLVSFGFGAMFPLLAPVPVLLMPSGETCELLHTFSGRPKNDGALEGNL